MCHQHIKQPQKSKNNWMIKGWRCETLTLQYAECGMVCTALHCFTSHKSYWTLIIYWPSWWHLRGLTSNGEEYAGSKVSYKGFNVYARRDLMLLPFQHLSVIAGSALWHLVKMFLQMSADESAPKPINACEQSLCIIIYSCLLLNIQWFTASSGR